MIKVINESDVRFIKLGRKHKKIRTSIWNKNDIKGEKLIEISNDLGIEIVPMFPNSSTNGGDLWENIWAETSIDNIENLFLFFNKVNNNYSIDELREIYENGKL